jgi:hypothetical protein
MPPSIVLSSSSSLFFNEKSRSSYKVHTMDMANGWKSMLLLYCLEEFLYTI